MTNAAQKPAPAGRPPVLYPLFKEPQSLTGIGPRLAKLLEKLDIVRVGDLLFLRPRSIIDRQYRPTIAEAEAGRIVTIKVTVDAHEKPSNRRHPYRVICSDETGSMTLIFFHGRADYLTKLLPVGEMRWISGTLETYNDRPQIVHPDFVAKPEELSQLPLVEPVYPLTAGLTNKTILKAIRSAISDLPDLPEWQDRAFLERQGWQSFGEAVRGLHAPQGAQDLSPSAPATSRLAYDELLASQLALFLIRAHTVAQRGRAFLGGGAIAGNVKNALPFSLTPSQNIVLEEIHQDLKKPERMVRLLQGDVGSGKTVVALLAAAIVAGAGAQTALMAPTEILARQHLETIVPLAEAAGLEVRLLTGRDKGKARSEILGDIASGRAQIIVGTHALFQADVTFSDLGLVVVDEQHRFGVHQRLALSSKGKTPTDLLVMTATPIPRTLTLALYGDMDVSRITGKPPGRKPVTTAVVSSQRLDEVVGHLDAAVGSGTQAYWVCPLVEESEQIDLANAEDRARELETLFPGKVGLVHGRMPGPEKEQVMGQFQSGKISILVATTVIEVGVNVPNASIMVVEHAERFGLSQLHQLRGRVGRGTAQSTCLLLYHPPLGETAKARLKILRETDDGFQIAEEDLRLRGAGDLLGSRQSGMPNMKIAELDTHQSLLSAARDDAKLIMTTDPNLSSDRGKALRVLLYLFERDEAIRLMHAG